MLNNDLNYDSKNKKKKKKMGLVPNGKNKKKRNWLVLNRNNKLNANRKINYVSNNKLNDKPDSKKKMTQLGLNIFGIFEFLKTKK